MVKVAINGFGRIGRLALRKLMEQAFAPYLVLYRMIDLNI